MVFKITFQVKDKFGLVVKYLILSLIVFIIGFMNCQAQKNLSGMVIDSLSNEKLIGATIKNHDNGLQMMTNQFGYFSVPSVNNANRLSIRYVGYRAKELVISNADSILIIKLSPVSKEIDEVTVVADRKTAGGNQTLNQLDFKNTPVLFAEKDVLKTIQLLPGIQQNAEGTSNFSVRGGSHDQNLMLLDGIPVYNINHLFGFVSVFNTDAINQVKFYKGNIPARYGGRISSVTDIVMREGHKNKYTGSVSMGIISSKFVFEGPIQKEKSSFLISGRRSIYDLFYYAYSTLGSKEKNGYYLQDLTMKANYHLNKYNTLYLSAYTGNDKVYSANVFGRGDNKSRYQLGWGNITGALRWNNTSVDDLFSNITLAYTKYKYLVYNEDKSINEGNEQYEYEGYSSGINDWIVRWDLSYYRIKYNQLNFGAEYISHSFNPGMMKLASNTKISVKNAIISGELSRGAEGSIYLEDNIDFRRLKLNLGIRQSWFKTEGVLYSGFQPRVSATLDLGRDMSFTAGYDRIFQYLHLVSNTNIGMPTDLWLPISKDFGPQSSAQISLGMNVRFAKQYLFTVEFFGKNMKNLTDYRDGIVIRNERNEWEEILDKGIGKSKGIELMIQKDGRRLSGWLNYTLSKSERTFAEINRGITFPFMYDRRYVVNILANYKLSDTKNLSLSWVGSNGHWMNVQYDGYMVYDQVIKNFNSRNNYQVPPFHHLDLSYTTTKVKKNGKRSWIFGIYNLYSRTNLFSIRQVYEVEDRNPRLIGVGLFPFIPFVSWEYNFN